MVNSPQELKKLSLKEKEELSKQIRKELINTVSKTGGHLASNLGIVELTIAIHSIFETPKDKIVWDVGHQCYVHKILTGRASKLSTLRTHNGLSGFPKTNESEYDTFNTGHSSTSISVASGIARARDIKGENYEVIAVIGDGSLTGGMALEALNDVGSSNLKITIILNDNSMSISKNIGGLSLLLSKIRTKKFYINLNSNLKTIIQKIPIIGTPITKKVQKLKKVLKQTFIKNMFFEDLGYTYLGPVNGHNIKELERILKKSKTISGPTLIHVKTIKGKGYKPAEANPSKFHATSPFNIETGNSINKKQPDYSKVFGEKLISLAKKDKKIVAITAAMKDGTGLAKFAEKYPNRFFDVGIAEQHALGLSAGLASNGLKPYVCIYSSFLQRGYDQIIHDICLQNLPVTICIDRAGIVGQDGETHQGIFDLSYLSTIPNLTIIAPKNFEELELMLDFSKEFNYPLAIRYPRGGEDNYKFSPSKKIEFKTPEIIAKGNDLTILAIGKEVAKAMKIRDLLLDKDITCEVINVRFLKPIDTKEIIKSIKKTKKIITLEDNLISGGLSSAIKDVISTYNLKIRVLSFGYNDKFIKQGTLTEIEKENHLDIESITKKILKELF